MCCLRIANCKCATACSVMCCGLTTGKFMVPVNYFPTDCAAYRASSTVCVKPELRLLKSRHVGAGEAKTIRHRKRKRESEYTHPHPTRCLLLANLVIDFQYSNP